MAATQDIGVALNLILEDMRLLVCGETNKATIRGGWRAFLRLATRREDPDVLFLWRRLLIEGDAELGLIVQ